jgi:hypothetical protein
MFQAEDLAKALGAVRTPDLRLTLRNRRSTTELLTHTPDRNRTCDQRDLQFSALPTELRVPTVSTGIEPATAWLYRPATQPCET